MKKGRVLHILNYYPPHLGGIEDVCKSIVDGTADYERMVLCYNDSNMLVRDTVDGVEIVRLPRWKEIARQQISFRFISVFRKIIREFRPDIIQMHVPNPLTSVFVLWLKPKNTKLILHWHSDITVHKFIHICYSPIEQLMVRRADAIIATSPNYIEGSSYIRPYKDKCVVIPNVVSQHKLDTPVAPSDIDNIKQRFGDNIVLFLGRHVPYKGLGYLVESIPLVKSRCQFLICGKGPETEKLKASCQGMANVHFLGRIADNDIGKYMRAAKVFAFPSVTKNEAWGIALAEAMYYGVVPVTFTINGSGVNWVNLDGETGIEVANGDAKSYAEAIDLLMTDEALRRAYSAKAHERVVNNFLIEHIKGRITTLYEKLI